ncbi:sodium:proton antiporter [Paenibacillus sp. N3.4]|uniref:cation:proton antiporter n=1 Tax=Paenibacillus sp. N3.4 TaxID=2603222 RepID=UPI0011C83B2E|nr:cation:proton antiporter [Paenibacillus sp. N3.4]TXK84308.1 sodium:proton antiporter [Paenibacillus sp. N3.4]
METSTSIMVEHVIILLVLVFGLGMIFGKAAQWLKLPDVAMFLLAGILVGQGLHWINESSTSFTNQFILVMGSALILFDGGRNIRLSGFRQVWLTVTLLSIPGVIITCLTVAAVAHILLGLPWLYALLLGSIISSTDPATLIPVFKQVKIRTKVRETVEIESAFNDATGSILTFSFLAIIVGTQEVSALSGAAEFAKMALGGLALGLVFGYIMTFLTAHLKLGLLRDFATIAMVVTALGAYVVGQLLGVSGFMATFTAGLIWGNADTFKLNLYDKRDEMTHFSDNITVIMRMLIFILLGSQVNFPLLLAHLWTSLGVIFVFVFIARPLTVLLCTWPDRKAKWQRNEILFMFWVRETGVIPAALCGLVAGMGVAHSDLMTSVTFMAVLITILLQASTTAYAARKLGLEVKADEV